MTRGTPDWGFGRIDTIHVLTEDLAELAARLGSLHVYDRGGHVVWYDDFNSGIGAWRDTVSGDEASVEVSTAYPKSPPYCVKLTGGSSNARNAQIRQYLPPVVLGAIGIEISVAFFTAFDTFRLNYALFTGAREHIARITLSDTDDKIYYRDSSGVNQEAASLKNVVHTNGVFHTIKLVANFSTDKYIRLLLDENSYDLSTIALQEFADTESSNLLVDLLFTSRSGQNDYCHVDNLVVTQNET